MRQILPRSFAVLGCAGLFFLAGAPAQALVYEAILAPDAPGATGSGSAKIKIIEDSSQMKVDLSFSGLSGDVTAFLVHATADAVNNIGYGSVVFALQMVDLAHLDVSVANLIFQANICKGCNPPFVAASGGDSAARDVFLAALRDGKAYVSLQTTTYPVGEISGFIAPAPVPGPLPLLGAGAALGWSRRLRRRLSSSSS